MSSRMDRYYKNDDKKRTSKNSSLYEEIYENRDYDKLASNLSDISVDTISTSSNKQIDIAEVKALLEKREEIKRNRQIVKESPREVKEIYSYEEENKTYDINDLIEKAREEKKEVYRPRKLADTQVLTLQELVNSKDYSNKSELDEEEMQDLLNSIYSTNMLKDSNGNGILDELKSTGNTIVSPNIKEILKEKKQEIESDIEDDIDKSFFTSNLNLKKSDFSSLKEEKNNNKLTTIIIVLLTLIFFALVGYIIIQFVI